MKGAMALANHASPSLPAGRYRVSVKQEASLAECRIADCALDFAVAAEQLALDPAQVYSRYPPAGAVGTYGECLPHIVLHRRTLPWERVVLEGADALPWLALLVFSHDDGVAVRDAEYGQAKAGGDDVFVPTLDRRHGSDDDACRFVDIPAALFAAILPGRADLAYTAHVRRVSLDDKVTDGGVKDEWFSCVTSCRHPRAPDKDEEAVRHNAHLVSLEGYGDFLAAADRRAHPTAAFGAMRVFSLADWEFWCERKPFDFRSLARQLTAAPMHTDVTTGTPALDGLLRLNHSPLPAALREGSQTVAWYRPPLLPQAPWNDSETARHFADSLLRYDPALGMFDISLQAAWQLGRLLALQNSDFSRQLLAWRRDHKRAAATRQNNAALTRRLREPWRDLAAALLAACGRLDETGRLDILASHAAEAAPVANTANDVPQPSARVNESWFSGALDAGFFHAASADDPAACEQRLAALLAGYALLYDIPFCYLVPHARLLPPDSIRFFHLDGHWLRTLMDGAMSLGRNAGIDYAHDTAFVADVYQRVFTECVRIRPARQGKPSPAPESSEPASCTGFLLRSPLVRGWRGLEFKAYADHAELRALRLETLSDEVLLGLYVGAIDRLEILEPPESLHYGFNRIGEKADKTLRRLDTGKLDPNRTVGIPLAPGRMVGFAAVAAAMAPFFPDVTPSSALMALEMIQNPYKIVISET